MRGAHLVWRELLRVRTAMVLLTILATLSVIGTLLPQLPQNPRGVMGYVLNHPTTGPIFARLGLYDIFSSWIFIVTAILFYTSLTAFLWVRVPSAWRRWRQGNRTALLWRDLSSIVFHASFYLLLVGVVWGKAAGFVGDAAIVEGDGFVEATANYDNLSEGVLRPQHAGFDLKLDSFRAAYWPTGAPSDFVSRVRIYDGGRLVMASDIQVNHYLAYQGDKIYQVGYGWAPRIRIETPDGRVVADSPTVFLGDQKMANGVVKAPSAGPPGQQVALSAYFIPDPRVSGDAISPGSAALRNPILLAQLWRGDLHLDRPQNVYSLDTTGMTLLWKGLVRVGDTATTPDGYQLSFLSVPQYSVLQVTRDPGVPIVEAAFAIAVASLLLTLYIPVIGQRQVRPAESEDEEPVAKAPSELLTIARR